MAHISPGPAPQLRFFPEERASKRAVRLRSVSIQTYDAIYLYAISFCHFTVGSGGALLVSLAAR